MRRAFPRRPPYVNTSGQGRDPYEGAAEKHPTERTLYWRHTFKGHDDPAIVRNDPRHFKSFPVTDGD